VINDPVAAGQQAAALFWSNEWGGHDAFILCDFFEGDKQVFPEPQCSTTPPAEVQVR
jgi:hypothetical protein